MSQANDKAFAEICQWLRSQNRIGFSGRGDAFGVFKKPQKKHRALVCAQPSQCSGSPSAFCPGCKLVTVRVS